MAKTTETTFESYIQMVKALTPSTRLAVAQQLKDAGYYTGKISDKFDTKLYNAVQNLEQDIAPVRAFNKKFEIAQPIDYTVFIQEKATERLSAGTGTDGGPTTTRQTYVTSASQTAKLLNTVAEDLLGRGLTKAEKTKYTKMLNAAQKSQPAVQTSGKGFTSTQGGVDEQQFITEQIAGTAEAKTNKATDAYAVMMEELGGLR